MPQTRWKDARSRHPHRWRPGLRASTRLVWPIKQKYGRALSWADLMVLTGNCSLEIMGLQPTGFGGGRIDAWEADRATYWGPEGLMGETVPGDSNAGVEVKVLDANHDGSKHGLFTDRPGALSNDFFRVLTSMDHEWVPHDDSEMSFDVNDRVSGTTKYTATRCDLVFGANAQLRNIAEVYGADDGQEQLVHDFVDAWHKVMMLDRYDVPEQRAAAVRT